MKSYETIRLAIIGDKEYTDTKTFAREMHRAVNLIYASGYKNIHVYHQNTSNGFGALVRNFIKMYKLNESVMVPRWADIETPPVAIKTNARGEKYNSIAGSNMYEIMAKSVDVAVVFWNGETKSHVNDFIKRYRKHNPLNETTLRVVMYDKYEVKTETYERNKKAEELEKESKVVNINLNPDKPVEPVKLPQITEVPVLPRGANVEYYNYLPYNENMTNQTPIGVVTPQPFNALDTNMPNPYEHISSLGDRVQEQFNRISRKLAPKSKGSTLEYVMMPSGGLVIGKYAIRISLPMQTTKNGRSVILSSWIVPLWTFADFMQLAIDIKSNTLNLAESDSFDTCFDPDGTGGYNDGNIPCLTFTNSVGDTLYLCYAEEPIEGNRKPMQVLKYYASIGGVMYEQFTDLAGVNIFAQGNPLAYRATQLLNVLQGA